MKNKDNQILTEILDEVKGLNSRVTLLEKAYVSQVGAQQIPSWLRKTYPEGFMTVADLARECPDFADNHQLLCGMVIGDAPDGKNDFEVIHPIVPMLFHDGELGYAYGVTPDGTLQLDTMNGDLPVFLGNPERATGMYIPFTCSEKGIDIAMDVCEGIKEDNKIGRIYGTIFPGIDS